MNICTSIILQKIFLCFVNVTLKDTTMLLLKTQPHDFMIKIKPLPNNTQGTHRRYNFFIMRKIYINLRRLWLNSAYSITCITKYVYDSLL